MKSIYLFLSVVFIATMVSCTGKTKKADEQTTVTEEVVTVETPSHIGAFTGTLPCADCTGIKTDLTLKEDGTYDLRSEYLDKKGDNVFETSGVYNVLDNGLIELVTPSSGEKTYYKHVENGMAVSDAAGTVNEGERAKDYVLTKK